MARTTSGAGARRCTRSPASSTPIRSSARASSATARWSPPATARWASSTTSTTGRTARPTRTRTRWPKRSRARRARAGIELVLLPAAYARAGPGQPAGAAPAALLRPRRRRVPRPRRGAAGVGRGQGKGSRSAWPPIRRGPCPADWLEAIAAYSEDAWPGPPRARRGAAARGGGGAGRARLLADRAARAHRLPRPAGERGARDPRKRAGRRAAGGERRDGGELPDHRGQPRRRPSAAAARSATPACRWRSEATRRCGSTRSRRRASWRRWRAARVSRAARCWPRAATCGAELCRAGAGSLGIETAGEIESTPSTPTCAGWTRTTSGRRS